MDRHPPPQARRHTYTDYLAWAEGARWELIDGAACARSPLPGPLHQTVAGELFRQIANHVLDKPCRVFQAPFAVRLPEADEPDERIATVVQPDICVICDPQRLDDKGCRGAPDWVIEVVSPGSAARDQIHKLALYERHTVREYWIVHPVDRVVSVYQLDERGGYGRPRISETEELLAVGVLPDLLVDWGLVFGRLPAP